MKQKLHLSACFTEITGCILPKDFFLSLYAIYLDKHVFVIHSWEFSVANYPVTTDQVTTTYRPTHVRYNNELYEIVRTYEVERGQLEITVN